MDISSSTSALSSVRVQSPQSLEQNRPTSPATGLADGNDQENDGDSDDGNVTATRGQNLNITA